MDYKSLFQDILANKNAQTQVHHFLPLRELCNIVAEYGQNLFVFILASQDIEIFEQFIGNTLCFSCNLRNASYFSYYNHVQSTVYFTICPQGHIECDLFQWISHEQRQQLEKFYFKKQMYVFFVNVIEYETCFAEFSVAVAGQHRWVSSQMACLLYKNL